MPSNPGKLGKALRKRRHLLWVLEQRQSPGCLGVAQSRLRKQQEKNSSNIQIQSNVSPSIS